VTRDWASGTCLVIRRACADTVGDFDESFGSYVEDVDYGLRANERGWTVMVDTAAEAWGLGTANTVDIAMITANTVRLAHKRRGLLGGANSLSLAVCWIVKGSIASVLPRRSAERRALSRYYASQRLRGIGLLAFRHARAVVPHRGTRRWNTHDGVVGCRRAR
jgi:cellulose synthase/poly-beta-1,6-N-acetylglucosamine synthase-like glycosyltransferase